MRKENRRADVLAALSLGTWTAAGVARTLNRDKPCPWCPVGPIRPGPRKGMRYARIPATSLRRVWRVLQSLVRDGLVKRYPGIEDHHPIYLSRAAVASIVESMKAAEVPLRSKGKSANYGR